LIEPFQRRALAGARWVGYNTGPLGETRFMSRPITALAILAAATAVGGCSTFQRAIGASKVSPDEFRVVTRAPLTLPPDYSLRPPAPGEPRPQELEPDAEARAAIFGEDVAVGASTGERTLVVEAGAATVDPVIREQIDYEGSSIVHRSIPFADRILSFRGAQAEADSPLDGEAEARRLEELESIRRATGGGEVLIQRNSPRGFKLPGT
jgi:hypothetical protein